MDKCFFCGDTPEDRNEPVAHYFKSVDCDLCGYYLIQEDKRYRVPKFSLVENNRWKVNCIHKNVKYYPEDKIPVWLMGDTEEDSNVKKAVDTLKKVLNIGDKTHDFLNIKEFRDLPIEHSQKINKILLLLSQIANKKSPDSYFNVLDTSSLYELKIDGKDEFFYWVEMLREKGYISVHRGIAGMPPVDDKFILNRYFNKLSQAHFLISPKGWLRISELSEGTSSKDVFIAMWFDEKTNDLREAIREAVKSQGLEAIFIDEVRDIRDDKKKITTNWMMPFLLILEDQNLL